MRRITYEIFEQSKRLTIELLEDQAIAINKPFNNIKPFIGPIISLWIICG